MIMVCGSEWVVNSRARRGALRVGITSWKRSNSLPLRICEYYHVPQGFIYRYSKRQYTEFRYTGFTGNHPDVGRSVWFTEWRQTTGSGGRGGGPSTARRIVRRGRPM
jgi:hypothetical protein